MEERLRKIQISMFESCEKFNWFMGIEFNRSMITFSFDSFIESWIITIGSLKKKDFMIGN